MTTLHIIAEKTEHEAIPVAGSPGGKARRYRRLFGGLLLALAVSATLLVGGWGVISSLAAGAPPARIGEAAEVPGGILRVEEVTPENMAPMQMGKFANKGMSMSGNIPDMTPDGQRRFNVDITLASAESGVLSYSMEDFRLTGEGMKATGPLRSKIGSGKIPAGSAVSNTLVFQVPEKAKDLTLSFGGGRPVALDLPASKDGGSHAGSGNGGDGH